MKNLWLPLAVTVALAGCSDRALESLVPRNALAVIVVDHPNLVAPALGVSAGELPWKSLNADRPWGAAVVPANPPGFLLAVAMADQPAAWPAVQTWARERGGLDAHRLGDYAVLTSPGLAAPSVLSVDQRFNLERVRWGNDPVSVYVDVQNTLAQASVSALSLSALPPWVGHNLAGLRLGLSARDGGLSVRLTTDWLPSAPVAGFLKSLGSPSDLSLWTGRVAANQAVGAALSLSPAVRTALGSLMGDAALAKRWAALSPLLGPRVAFSASPRADGSWTWAAAVEASEPEAIRQALKTLVASGDLQRHFPEWALDADTPFIYRDQPDAWGGIRTQVTLGTNAVQIAYGPDRVALAGGVGALDAAQLWKRPASAASWYREAPADASALVAGSIDGLGGRGALRVMADGNVEFRVWTDAAGVKAWEERLPQAALGWLTKEGGWTRAEP